MIFPLILKDTIHVIFWIWAQGMNLFYIIFSRASAPIWVYQTLYRRQRHTLPVKQWIWIWLLGKCCVWKIIFNKYLNMSRTEFSHGVVKICQILKYMYLFSVVVQFLWLLLQYTWLPKLLQTKSPRKVRFLCR